jgi:hypothetical protein
MKRFYNLLLFISVLSLGCSQTAEEPVAVIPPWHRVDQAALEAAGQAQLVRAIAARDALLDRLNSRIGEVMAAEGPAAAILVCKREAPQMAQDIGRDHHLNLGGTSFALRNPNNKPPEWAEPLIAERPDQPVVLEREDGYLAALLPAKFDEGCATCHGQGEQVPAEVKDTLAEYYPQDEAMGFHEGDLRGWFWAVVDNQPVPPKE